MAKRKSVKIKLIPQATTSVAVLLPTLARAAQMKERVGALLAQAVPDNARLTVYLAVQVTDTDTLTAAAELAAEYGNVAIVERPPATTAVQGWNLAQEQAYADGADWYVLGADDVVWHDGWLAEALKVAGETKAHLIGMADGYSDLNDRACHFMVSRLFCHRVLKGFIHPAYRSWRFDREISRRAQALDVYAPAPGALLEHLHPAVGKAEMDETYRTAVPDHETDLVILNERLEAGFKNDGRARKALKGE
jgi:hypothetical protein